jgi:hypothetical protein
MSTIPFSNKGSLLISNPFDLPEYDTVVESSTSVMTAGGTLTFFQGSPSGLQVAQFTITIGGDGSRTIQRTA